MRLFILCIILLFLFITPVMSQKGIIKHDTIVFVENTLHKVSKNVNFTIIPGPVSGVSQKVGFVVLPMLVYNLKKSDTLSPPSSSAILFYFDFYGSWATAVKQSFYWNQNKWRAFISFGVANMKLKFFGVGNDTAIISNNDSNFVWTHQKGINISLICFRKIYKGLYGGLEYRYNISDLDGDDSTSTAILDKSGYPTEQLSESVLIPTFVWDDRDNIFWSAKGYYASLNFQFANTLLLSSRNYNVISGWVNGYHSLLRSSKDLTLAWHFYMQAGWGDLPYHRNATFGQGDDATGYTRGKYVNHSETTIQAELRYEVWKFIACGVYGGTGKVFTYYNLFGQSAWLHFGGLRLYLNIIPSKNIRLRLDGAIARKDWGFYIGIGQGF
jgi:hypothetical protein